MIVAYDNPGKAADKLLKAFGDNPINIEGVILPVPKQVLKNGKKFHFFVYPNVKLSQQQFIGCGRYIANDTSLGENFKPATLGIGGKIEELYIIASILAPESSEMGKRIYEIQDIPGIIYRGKSQNFAYLLVLISRSRKIKLEGIHGDIWCTGSIRLLEGKNPILETIDPTVFGINLEAFLSKENHDKLFIIPSSALLPSHYQILREMGKYLNIVSLTQFQKLSTQEFAERKTILKVFENELEVLINIIFHPPQHYKNQGKIVKNDLSISKIPISEKSDILSSELWQPYLAGTPVTAADIPKQEHTFQLDDGHVLIRCYWEGQRGREQGYLWLSWAVAISKKKTLCILFFNPETMEVRHQVQLGTFLDGEEIFTFAELGFDPVQEKWAISCRLDSIDGGGKR